MSYVERRYVLHCGLPGKQTWDLGAGISVGVTDAEIWYVCGFFALNSMSCDYVQGEWIYTVICNVAGLTQAQIDALDAFLNGLNNTVIGLYPPRLLSPALTFTKTAYSNEALLTICQDLVGRGIGRQPLFYNGDNLEIWTNVVMSAGQKNQLALMWKNRLLDAETNRPL